MTNRYQPNLQNIPTRTEKSQRIQDLFVDRGQYKRASISRVLMDVSRVGRALPSKFGFAARVHVENILAWLDGHERTEDYRRIVTALITGSTDDLTLHEDVEGGTVAYVGRRIEKPDAVFSLNHLRDILS